VPRVFTTGGSTTTTLEEYTFPNFVGAFRDHIRFPQSPQALGDATHPATESAIGMGPQSGLAAAVRRNNPPPWQNVLDDTMDGANSFGSATDVVVQPVAAGQSISDPIIDFGGGKFHYVDFERDIGSCSAFGTERIVYRRGTSAAYIAGLQSGSPDLFVLPSDGSGLDHPGMVVTEDATGAATAHVMWWDQSNAANQHVFYWKLLPSGQTVGPTAIDQLP